MEKYYEEFNKYVSNFDLKDPVIISKYNHSLRVMNLQKKYSKLIGFNNDDIELATLIGILHDIGRFKQYEEYHTFADRKSVDHADLGAEILINDGLINRFWNKEEDYSTIDFSIKNHNKYKIEGVCDDKTLEQAKLIRDTDKLDIVYLLGELKEYNNSCDSKLSDKIVETIFEHKPIDIHDVEHKNDAKATYFAFAFDFNNAELLNELKLNLNTYYQLINHDNIYDEIYNEVNKYIDERNGKYVRKKIQSLRS